MADNPLTLAGYRQAVSGVSLANPDRVFTGNPDSNLITGTTTKGHRILRVDVKATGTTTAGMIRFWWRTFDGATTAQLLFDELAVTAVTPSATVKAWTGSIDLFAPVGPAGFVALYAAGPTVTDLVVSTEKAEEFIVTALIGDY